MLTDDDLALIAQNEEVQQLKAALAKLRAECVGHAAV